jgi:diacylglycerol kinase
MIARRCNPASMKNLTFSFLISLRGLKNQTRAYATTVAEYIKIIVVLIMEFLNDQCETSVEFFKPEGLIFL